MTEENVVEIKDIGKVVYMCVKCDRLCTVDLSTDNIMAISSKRCIYDNKKVDWQKKLLTTKRPHTCKLCSYGPCKSSFTQDAAPNECPYYKQEIEQVLVRPVETKTFICRECEPTCKHTFIITDLNEAAIDTLYKQIGICPYDLARCADWTETTSKKEDVSNG